MLWQCIALVLENMTLTSSGIQLLHIYRLQTAMHTQLAGRPAKCTRS